MTTPVDPLVKAGMTCETCFFLREGNAFRHSECHYNPPEVNHSKRDRDAVWPSIIIPEENGCGQWKQK